MAAFSMEMPKQVEGTNEDVRQLRQYLVRLVTRLIYTLNNLDSENVTQGGLKVKSLDGGAAGVAEAVIAQIGTANIGRATAQHLRAQVAEMVTAVIKTAVIDWASVTDMEVTKAYVETLRAKYANVATLEAEIARIADLRIAEAHISEADVQMLRAYCAQIVDASIQTATIDWAQLTHAVAGDAIVARFVGDQMYIDRLGVNSAQVVDLTVSRLCLKAANGAYYTLSVDTDTTSGTYGQVTATQRTVTAAEISAGITDDRKAIVETDLTVAQLNAQTILAAEAVVRHLTAEQIDADTLMARQAVINRITTGTIAAQLGASLNLTGNTSVIANVMSTQEWTELQGDAESAATVATDAQQGLIRYSEQTDSTLAVMQQAIAARVTQTEYDAGQQAISERVGAVEVTARRAETSVRDILSGIGTHLIVEPDFVRITQDQNGAWELRMYADRMDVVNTQTGTVAATFGRAGAKADRLQSERLLCVGTDAAGWYDMTAMATGVADKWRDGTQTQLRPLITEDADDCLLEFAAGDHPLTDTTAWPETAVFAVRAVNADAYRWQSRGGETGAWEDVDGGTARTLSVQMSARALGREYRCLVTGAGGETVSRTARARYKGAPGAIRQPQSVTGAASGALVILTAEPVGAAGLQWQVRAGQGGAWSSISGATGTSLERTAGSAAWYRLVMTDAAGRIGTTKEALIST